MTEAQKTDRIRTQRSNTRLVLSAIQAAGELSRTQVSEATGVNIMTVGRIAEDLIARGLLREREKEGGSQVGRPPRLLSLEEGRLFCASMFLGREALHLGVVDPRGRVHGYTSLPVPEGDFSPERIVPWMADSLSRFLEEQQNVCSCPTVGVVVPGVLDTGRGEMLFSANLHWHHVPLLAQLRQRLPGSEFILENDVKAVAVAEHQFGCLRDCRNVVVLSIGDGVGAAVMLDGEIYRGRNNMAGEIGHIIINPAGKICECGKAGCLQTYLSTRMLLAEARTVYPDTTLPELFELFQDGDPFATALVNQVAEYIAIAINLLANAYAPEVVLLCGSMMRQGPVLSELVAGIYRDKLTRYMKDDFQLQFEQFGVNGHLIGGGALALRHELDKMCR